MILKTNNLEDDSLLVVYRRFRGAYWVYRPDDKGS
jgi:hypothetical protein